ncbi:nitronate monooxygenase [Kitasatospora fiedleri]|uniref:nitronate monooxygenase n=1 Tax=Kitasatospora fiedleri TaxID=2991545 RepID=UPI002989B399|nr:nitronate monooxygenase [Kitasatospora fiedleri]
MAGGAGTPELVAAVNGAGGLGFLAAGYRSAEGLRQQVGRARELTDRPIGVNLFVPGPPAAPGAVDAYRERLRPEALRRGSSCPPRSRPTATTGTPRSNCCCATPSTGCRTPSGCPNRPRPPPSGPPASGRPAP